MPITDSQLESESAASATADLALEAQLERFVRGCADPMIVTDGRGEILLSNVHALLLFGYAERELVGRNLDLLVPDALRRRPAGAFDVPAKARALASLKNGGEIHVEIYATVLGTSDADPIVWTLRDASLSERAVSDIARSEKRLNEAQRIAKVGNWEWDVVNDTHWWSEELYRMLGIDPNDERHFYTVFLERVHPDDREIFANSRGRVLATGKPDAYDVRVLMPDGEERVVQCQGEIVFDDHGRIARMSGTLQDITDRKNVEAALRLSEARYKEAQRIAMMGNWEWNAVTDESWWSDELYAMLEEDRETYPACLENFIAKLDEADRETVRSLAEQPRLDDGFGPNIGPDDFKPIQVRLAFPDGRVKIVEMRTGMIADEHGRPVVISGTVRDVTERWELQSMLRESEERYASTVELAAIGIAHVDASGRFVWANQHLCEMLGYEKDELLGCTFKELSHSEDVDVSDEQRVRLHAGEVDSLKFEKRYVRKDGTVIWVRITCSSRRDADGELLYDISAVEDISDRKAAEARVQYLATHDEMTGLPNRVTLKELLAQSITSARRHGARCGVLFIDLDRFKIVNDSLGHHAGDMLLKEMAKRLRACVRESDVVARLGGDEFVVLIDDLSGDDAAADVARKVISQTFQPFEILAHECRVTASIGIAIYPDHARDASTLLKHADMAMYQAKDEGKNTYQFYSPHSSPMAVENLVLESHLNHALEQNEFTVQYQPKVDLATGTVSGTEALLRWWNPELGTVSPAQFIPLAEDTGLIVPIGRWILRAACAQNVAWHRQGLPRMVMAVNLSPRQFKEPSLLDDVASILEETGLAPQLLELEITESMIMHDVDRAVERARALKRLGVRLAIDDFGTGYSSLSQLKRFPIDTLKVDRSFVRDLPGNAEDCAIAEAIVSLGKTLGVTVVAEGVETKAQLDLLRELGCDEMQGFYFSKPCHPDAFAELLASESERIGPPDPSRERGIRVNFG